MADILATTDRVTREKRVLTGPPQPVMKTIWHKETGKPLEVFAVDAQEILAQPDTPYQDVAPGQEKVKAAPLDHSVKEVIGTSSTPTIIESAPAASTAKVDKAASAGDTEDARSKTELQEAAEAKGIAVKASHTKADIQKLLELDTKTKGELQEMAEAKGIEAKGTKAELINALAAAE